MSNHLSKLWASTPSVPVKPGEGWVAPRLLTPNSHISKTEMRWVWLGWIAAGLIAWQWWPSSILPRPMETWYAFTDLWMNEGLGQQLLTSYWVQLQALAIATVLSLVLAYSAVIPLVRPLAVFISTWRFVSLGPLVIFFTLLVTSEGHSLKLLLLIFGITVFYLTAMLPAVLDVPTEELDHARTLRMGELRVTNEVIIKGRMDTAVELMIQNAAMGWVMVFMVEGLVRSEGGIGYLMLNQIKHFRLAQVAAIIIVLFIVGLLQDLALRGLRRMVFPYADLEKEKR